MAVPDQTPHKSDQTEQPVYNNQQQQADNQGFTDATIQPNDPENLKQEAQDVSTNEQSIDDYMPNGVFVEIGDFSPPDPSDDTSNVPSEQSQISEEEWYAQIGQPTVSAPDVWFGISDETAFPNTELNVDDHEVKPYSGTS